MAPGDSAAARWLELNTRARVLARELERLRAQNPADLASYRATRRDLRACLAALGSDLPAKPPALRAPPPGGGAPSAG